MIQPTGRFLSSTTGVCAAASVTRMPILGVRRLQLTLSDVVSVQVSLTDGALFDRMNTIYKATFKEPKPTRTTVVVAKLVGTGHIEITATAKK